MGSSVSRPNVYFPESYKSSFKGKVLIIGTYTNMHYTISKLVKFIFNSVFIKVRVVLA